MFTLICILEDNSMKIYTFNDFIDVMDLLHSYIDVGLIESGVYCDGDMVFRTMLK